MNLKKKHFDQNFNPNQSRFIYEFECFQQFKFYVKAANSGKEMGKILSPV